jgi:hypothetical protein
VSHRKEKLGNRDENKQWGINLGSFRFLLAAFSRTVPYAVNPKPFRPVTDFGEENVILWRTKSFPGATCVEEELVVWPDACL